MPRSWNMRPRCVGCRSPASCSSSVQWRLVRAKHIRAAPRLAAERQVLDLAQFLGERDIVEAGIDGGHEGRPLGAEWCGQTVGGRLATALVARGCAPARLEAALQALKLPDAQPQTLGSLPIGDASCESGLDQAGPEQLLPAHREGLHGGMTLPRRELPTTLSRSSYPMTFSCSSSTG